MRSIAIVSALILALALPLFAGQNHGCTTIQSGLLTDVRGIPLTSGYDQWAYNYQAMMFNGFYDNFTRPPVPVTTGDKLIMKWNDAWLSNKDCDGDGKLDRHFGYPSYIGSGAWLTNHMEGSYTDSGRDCHWTYFVKIVAAPADAVRDGGVWKTSGGIEIGSEIWNEFAVVQEVSNDTCAGQNGVMYKSAVAPGFGVYKP